MKKMLCFELLLSMLMPLPIFAGTPILSLTLNSGNVTTLDDQSTAELSYKVTLSKKVPSQLSGLSVIGGLPYGATQLTNGISYCSGLTLCARTFSLHPGDSCCLKIQLHSSMMGLGQHTIAPIVATNPPAYQGQASPYIVRIAKPISYWVATNGNDSNNGSQQSPFKTIQHAQLVVRHHPQKGIQPIIINIKQGTYRLTAPLKFTAIDSGSQEGRVIYRAAPNHASPVISGGIKVTGWTLHDLAKNIWKAHVNVTTSTMPRQLYVNNQRATRARTIDNPNYYTPTTLGYDYFYLIGSDPQIPPTWSNISAVEAVTVTQWKMTRCRINDIKPTDKLIMQNPCWKNANVYPSPWDFHLLSWFENAYEFLSAPGEWYLNPKTKVLYYIPRTGEDINKADVELPILETLIQGHGSAHQPIQYLSFSGLTFQHATWLGPNSSNGYVPDQSSFRLEGNNHKANKIGHDPDVVRTPGNIQFSYAHFIDINKNTFEHLGAIALDFAIGSQNNVIENNKFKDVSAAAIQLGGVSQRDFRPKHPAELTKDNTIRNNQISYIGREYYDAPGIFIGSTTHSVVTHNNIRHVPWAGIAIGWGWGLLDRDGFPGLLNATFYQWGHFHTPSASKNNELTHNKIEYFLEKLWDGGSIYNTGYQGSSYQDGLLIGWNLARHKRSQAGSNIFYTDGGSRYITLKQNISFNNPPGFMDFGPCLKSSSFPILCLLTNLEPYGADMGGCIPYGDLKFEQNYFQDKKTFFQPCSNPLVANHPVNLVRKNIKITSISEVPSWILKQAGKH